MPNLSLNKKRMNVKLTIFKVSLTFKADRIKEDLRKHLPFSHSIPSGKDQAKRIQYK